MAEEDQDNEHPKSGIISVLLTGIGLIMLAVSKPLGFTLTEDLNISFIAYLFVSMMLATIGIFAGMAGLERQKKIFPVTGLVMGGVFILFIAYIIITSVGVG